MKRIKLSKGRYGLLLGIMMYPLYLITCIIPKKQNLLVLGSTRGHEISDNAKYLFLYLKEKERGSIDYFFLTKNRDIYKKALLKNEQRILYIYTVKGIYTLIRAKHILLTHALEDLIPFLLGGKYIHQLWHGSPLKKIGFDADNWEKSKLKDTVKKTIYTIFPYTNYMYCNKLYVSSDSLKNVMSSAFNLNKSDIISLGQPRNDFLLNKKILPNSALELISGKYDKVISWLPTHRGFSGKTAEHLLHEYKFNKSLFNEFLVRNNYLFIIKPHFVERADLENYLSDCSNILIYEEIDPYPLLLETDVLITDYSSVLFDYLHLNKQAIFTPFDFEFYTNEIAELYFEYEDIAYGPICHDWIEVLEVMKINDQLNYKDKIEVLKQKYGKEDINSCSKIIDYVSNL
ncbi:CDP-glycerol glycerophosphotransferase family protein [Bacillus sp. FJAT-50079]|uniref:CDP-glycerol glycerophosphotransferase family protein n=1 Tax=Bacillus sp. FJAT-50079 TaxID=2833577 RepID=UPI001BCA0150|nr:CDP-glycerol glycerophosphotransferase family protein [Bacillus sp. FJAT-50079]MBS4206711.1 CDP-glycerol glycerophosphotransferase family protein [Bacillus sp. FJAT-50079]